MVVSEDQVIEISVKILDGHVLKGKKRRYFIINHRATGELRC